MSAKNELQEFLLAGGRLFPQYKTERSGGSDHSPTFISTVKYEQTEIVGEECSSKKSAEQSAAQEALDSFAAQPLVGQADQPPPPCTLPFPWEARSRQNAVVLIDHENIQKLPGIENLRGLATVYAFSSRTNYLSNQKLPNFVVRITVDSTQNDACDVAIIIIAARLTADTIVFVSRDKIFGVTAELFRQNGIDAVQLTCIEECLHYLGKF